jgi:hypothetical protein
LNLYGVRLATEVNQTRRADPGGEWGPPPIKIILPNIPQTFHCSIIGTCFSTPKEGRLLHKALDRRHRALLNQFKSATGTAALSTLWREAVGKGQIPGAYWAILTHEDTDDTLVQEVFGEVHMLSIGTRECCTDDQVGASAEALERGVPVA